MLPPFVINPVLYRMLAVLKPISDLGVDPHRSDPLALAAAPTPRSRVMQPLTVTNAVEPS